MALVSLRCSLIQTSFVRQYGMTTKATAVAAPAAAWGALPAREKSNDSTPKAAPMSVRMEKKVSMLVARSYWLLSSFFCATATGDVGGTNVVAPHDLHTAARVV